MRQGQQNRRGRGRNNNNQNRKGQNPLTRSFESTGPDVKIRGTPAHIAEKYMTLARDAQSSGDPVLAENYLQHAEHYNRIIMAFREQLHALRSAAANIGARGIYEMCLSWRHIAPEDFAIRGETHLKKLTEEFERVRMGLRGRISDHTAAA